VVKSASFQAPSCCVRSDQVKPSCPDLNRFQTVESGVRVRVENSGLTWMLGATMYWELLVPLWLLWLLWEWAWWSLLEPERTDVPVV